MRRIEFQWLEKFEPINPGREALAALEPYRKKRWGKAADLQCVFSPLGFLCAWCNSREIAKGKRKYCSEACRRSAYMYVAPQDPALKLWILIHRQACACAGCKEDFEDQIADRINKRASHQLRNDKSGSMHFVDSVKYFFVGMDTGEIWHVDHVQPLHRGGDGIGFENIQVLCVKCHLKKTASEMGAPERKKKCERSSSSTEEA